MEINKEPSGSRRRHICIGVVPQLSDEVANAQICNIIVRKFELQSTYYAHLQTNTKGKDMNSLIPTS